MIQTDESLYNESMAVALTVCASLRLSSDSVAGSAFINCSRIHAGIIAWKVHGSDM